MRALLHVDLLAPVQQRTFPFGAHLPVGDTHVSLMLLQT